MNIRLTFNLAWHHHVWPSRKWQDNLHQGHHEGMQREGLQVKSFFLFLYHLRLIHIFYPSPLYVKSFQSWAGEEAAMKAVFGKARDMAPCVVILEDLDSLINDSNRSYFLNQLDGFEGKRRIT
jgi:hypothetical protein